MDCEGCTLKLKSFLRICDDQQQLLEFLKSHDVIQKSVICSSCGEPATFDNRKLKWRCQKTKKVKKGHKIQKISCSFSITIRKGTWFENANISIEAACTLIGYFVTMNPPRQKFLETELEMSSRSIVDWCNFIREALLSWSIENSKQIGGPNCIVEIDEAKFGKRKYHRGRVIDGQWLFGGFERESKELFVIAVPDKSTATLLSVIKTNVLPGTTIMSDCWKAYNCLDTEGFQHLTVNHNYNFVDPDTGTHTQNIERIWREVRANIPRYGRSEYHMDSYIAGFYFKRKYPDHTQRFHQIFNIISLDNKLKQNNATGLKSVLFRTKIGPFKGYHIFLTLKDLARL
ncbi:hypothetical protein DMN91_003215 [Ooceraea biroi]|uniref:ISXO2-like transposase domain-containing protein n=1 Tax=Ooceraea biroi TaxID=2015173 RepID=A0A3L8DY24_OOCBI|nr:hypothetical protein DMN91_003215 [Ooceraea biroi]